MSENPYPIDKKQNKFTVTSWTGISMKTAAVYAPATARKTSPASAVLPSGSSNPKVCAALHRKCENSHATSVWSLITCA